jgi:hypothetical protein
MAPSEDYFNQVIAENYFSAFQNYEMLALLDSFTVLGYGNYCECEEDYGTFNTWFRSYFSLYVFNLYIRYSLYRHNVNFRKDPLKQRDEFTAFLIHFNLRHVSFNFLPNLIFDRMRKALGVEEEIQLFEKRLGSLAQSIQEQQEKKQAVLLTIISVLSSLQAVDPILGFFNKTKQLSGIPEVLFWILFGFILVVLGGLAFWFFLPFTFRKVIKRIKKKIAFSRN